MAVIINLCITCGTLFTYNDHSDVRRHSKTFDDLDLTEKSYSIRNQSRNNLLLLKRTPTCKTEIKSYKLSKLISAGISSIIYIVIEQ